MLCETYKEHRDAMLRAIDIYFPDGVSHTNPQGGPVCLGNAPGMDGCAQAVRCVRDGKGSVCGGKPFFADGGHDNTLRMNFSMPTVSQIETGVERMSRVIRQYEFLTK